MRRLAPGASPAGKASATGGSAVRPAKRSERPAAGSVSGGVLRYQQRPLGQGSRTCKVRDAHEARGERRGDNSDEHKPAHVTEAAESRIDVQAAQYERGSAIGERKVERVNERRQERMCGVVDELHRYHRSKNEWRVAQAEDEKQGGGKIP